MVLHRPVELAPLRTTYLNVRLLVIILFPTVILKVRNHIGKYLQQELLATLSSVKLAGCTALLALDSVELNANSGLFLTLSHSRTRRRFVWLPVFFDFENAILPKRGQTMVAKKQPRSLGQNSRSHHNSRDSYRVRHEGTMSVTDAGRAMVANSDCFGGSALHRAIEAFHTVTSFIGL